MVDVAYAKPDEREEVAQFMNKVFVRAKWDMDGWRRLVAGRWAGPSGEYAITVRDGAMIVGVLGLVFGTRQTSKGMQTTADMSSWYILKEYRGQGVGQKMIALATQDPTVTIVNFSSAKAAVSVLENAGLKELDRDGLVWHPSNGPKFEVSEDPLSLGEKLPPKDRKMITDHQGLGLRHVTVKTPDGPCTMSIYPQKKNEGYVTHEVMYLSNQNGFARHAKQVAASVLPEREAILSLDRRFGMKGIEYDDVRDFATPRFFKQGLMHPSEVDMLYPKSTKAICQRRLKTAPIERGHRKSCFAPTMRLVELWQLWPCRKDCPKSDRWPQ